MPRPVPTLSEDDQYKAWVSDIERINHETSYVFEKRLIFNQVQDLYKNNQELQDRGGLVYDWLWGMYGRDQVLAIRREADDSNDVTNLIRLMNQISARPEVVSRRRYLAHFEPGHVIPVDEQNAMFTRLAGAGDHIDPAIIRQDRKALLRACKPVVTYGDKMVAHRTSMKLSLTLKEIHDALEAIEEALKKYYAILTLRSLSTAEPSILFAWQHVFDIPWRRQA